MNIVDIDNGLITDRHDNPDMLAFVKYCTMANSRHQEDTTRELARMFLGLETRQGPHRCESQKWPKVDGLIPQPQSSLNPDFTLGLDGDGSDILRRLWLTELLPGFVSENTILCVNGIIECKSVHNGSLFKAVSIHLQLSRLSNVHGQLTVRVPRRECRTEPRQL